MPISMHDNPPSPFRTSEPCRLYVMDISYFSGKIEAYLRYKRIPFTRVEAHHAVLLDPVYRRTGVAQVPAVEFPDGGWLRDSTAIVRWFEAHRPERRILPADPALGFLMELIEDYADEWLWRPAMWWRWMPHGSSRNLGWRIATEIGHSSPGPAWLKARIFAWRQRRTWLWGDGMTRANSAVIRAMYLDQLDALEAILCDRPFLLGARPSLADFGYFGPMFRHFFCDPDPGAVMRQRAPRVTEWVARLWNAASLDTAAPDFAWPQGAGWQWILADVEQHYLPYLEQNAAAFTAGRRRFDAALHGIALPGSVTHPGRAACLAVLQASFRALASDQRDAVLTCFAAPDAVAAILGAPPDPRVPEMPSGPEYGVAGGDRSWVRRMRARIFGTPR